MGSKTFSKCIVNLGMLVQGIVPSAIYTPGNRFYCRFASKLNVIFFFIIIIFLLLTDLNCQAIIYTTENLVYLILCILSIAYVYVMGASHSRYRILFNYKFKMM